jgi:hypothetical protein
MLCYEQRQRGRIELPPQHLRVVGGMQCYEQHLREADALLCYAMLCYEQHLRVVGAEEGGRLAHLRAQKVTTRTPCL